MPYIVRFTDNENKTDITVFDNTSNEDTSLSFPGRNVTGYGRIIAENFLHLLENFSSGESPVNPVEGQLWYDSANGILQIWDNTQWKAASNIQKSNVEPSVETSRVGELWVDTTNQQLYVFSGSNWILVGPNFSTGLRSGPVVESIIDSDNVDRVILTFYVEDTPVMVISKDSFTPKNSINGFTVIRTGMNITSLDIGEGGFLPKFYGTATLAESLNVGGVAVPSSRFLRSDSINTVERSFNVRTNDGITIGIDGNLNLSTSATSAKIYNSLPGSSIDVQVNQSGVPSTVLKVINNTIGINQENPDEALDVNGNIKTNGTLILTNTSDSISLTTGSLVSAGGVSIAKNLNVGTDLGVIGNSLTANIEPRENERYDLGTLSRRWNTVRAKTIVADIIVAPLQGDIIGNASTATNLRFPTTFRMQGDITSNNIIFDGQVGGTTKTFSTILTSGIIKDKIEPTPNISRRDDYVLIYREGSDLLKMTRDAFISDLGVPIGTILPFAGSVVPFGYLLCDGGEVEITKYRDLYNVIGDVYVPTGYVYRGSPGITFVLPDLRGRFPLGKDNMDNENQVPLGGGFTNAGGGDANRVGGEEADTVGRFSGTSTASITLSNLPDHEHTMKGASGNQFYATVSSTVSPTDGGGAFLGRGGTTPGQTQYLPTSGFVKKDTGTTLGNPFSVMNPYLTINYIIRSGPPAF
jgi:microcystin-dependent protein